MNSAIKRTGIATKAGPQRIAIAAERPNSIAKAKDTTVIEIVSNAAFASTGMICIAKATLKVK